MFTYTLWITHDNGKFEKFCFNTMKEAYIYYLDNFATPEDDEYYVECCGKHLIDVADNDRIIACMFHNVFNPKHHLYHISRRSDGKMVYDEV